MKRYILTGMVLLTVNITASENPFDLKENFGQLEQDQEVLLTELKKISDLKELAEEKKLAEKEARELANTEAETQLQKEDLPVVKIDDGSTPIDVKSNNIAKQESLPQYSATPSREKLNAMRQKALEASIIESMKKETLKQEVVKKEVLEKAAQSKKAELKKAKQEALAAAEAKKEAEMHEVEIYEKKRAERLARKIAEFAALEKDALVQKEVKVKALAEAAAKQSTKAIETDSQQVDKSPTTKKAKIDMVKTEGEVKSTVKVIDIKREKEDAKIAADKAYEEAVKEMSQEETISS